MSNDGPLHVSEPSGPRWELAKSLLDSGEGPVLLGDVSLWRDTSGPNADNGSLSPSVSVNLLLKLPLARPCGEHMKRSTPLLPWTRSSPGWYRRMISAGTSVMTTACVQR